MCFFCFVIVISIWLAYLERQIVTKWLIISFVVIVVFSIDHGTFDEMISQYFNATVVALHTVPIEMAINVCLKKKDTERRKTNKRRELRFIHNDNHFVDIILIERKKKNNLINKLEIHSIPWNCTFHFNRLLSYFL